MEELTFHLQIFPEGKGAAAKSRVILYLLWLRQLKDGILPAAVRDIFAFIWLCESSERKRNSNSHNWWWKNKECGCSSAIVEISWTHSEPSLLALWLHPWRKQRYQISFHVERLPCVPRGEGEELYQKSGWDVFSQNIVGTNESGSQTWGNTLKDRMRYTLMIETARNPGSPKVAAVSAMIHRGVALTAFVFRKYGHFLGLSSY